MKNFSETSDEAIKLTNKLGVDITNLSQSEDTGNWYFTMKLKKESYFMGATKDVSMISASMVSDETWIGCQLTSNAFNNLMQ